MIFVTVGTSDEPFDRLIELVMSLPRDEPVLIQHGASSVRPESATCIPFLAYDELIRSMQEARAVVTHAGVGSIMATLSVGKRPIVLPRLRALEEAVDDHQLELARRLDAAGVVAHVSGEHDLVEALAASSALNNGAVSGGNRLARDLRRYIEERVPVQEFPRTG